jgi:hypothetical protein
MTSKREQLIAFLADPKIPDELIFSEAGRRMVKKRDKSSMGRKKVMRQCKFCDEFHGFRDMRKHVAEAHPGGKFVHEPQKKKPAVGIICLYCNEVYPTRAMRKHVQDVHPEKCNLKNRGVRVKSIEGKD